MLTNGQLRRMRQTAMLSMRFHPLEPGDNRGVVYYPDGDIAIDCEGHEATAELLANAQIWILELLSELEQSRQLLQDFAEDLHLAECAKVDQDTGYVDPSQVCHCHMIMAWQALHPEPEA
jgi:hypothetical protein